MKRKLFILGATLAGTLLCHSFVVEQYDGFRASWLSDDGRFVISSNSGIAIRDRLNDKTYTYGSSTRIGAGNAVSDNGIIVGCTDACTVPAYWIDGEWHPLPHPMTGVTYARADGITPDGNVIIGTLDCTSQTKVAYPSVQPVMWVKNAETGEYEFEMLPFPALDFTGTSPQQVCATYVSDDAKTIMGQVTDRRGFVDYNMVIRTGADGEKTVTTPGLERLVKEGAEWPEWPERPVKPKEADYMTPDEILAFNKANQAYKDSLEIVSLTGINPRAPWPKDFIKEHKDEWNESLAKYEEESSSYLKRLYAFNDAYAANLYDTKFSFKTEILSHNGKYAASGYVYGDPYADPSVTKKEAWCSPILYQMDGEEETNSVFEHKSLMVNSLFDDGSMVVSTPTDDGSIASRDSYMLADFTDGLRPIDQWIAEVCPEAYEWIDQKLRFDVTAEQAADGVASEKRLLCGTVRLSKDQTKMVTYMYHPVDKRYITYFFDFAKTDGVATEVVNSMLDAVTANGELVVYGAPERIALFDMSGRNLLSVNSPAERISINGMDKGVYVVMLTKGSQTKSVKIML